MQPIVVNSLNKTYGNGQVVAVKDVSFTVNEGELFGLIGPDGAGKTSIFRILTTLLLADSGTATVTGFNVVSGYREIRKRVGYMPGKFSLYPDLTIEENLTFFATIFNTTIEENYHLIRDIYVQIEPFRNRRAGKLSGGMKQKLALCCALIHKPEVLFLDEPTTGVDPVSRKEFWEMLRRLKAGGITILVSTPYMDEATLCDRVALMQAGSIMTIDTPAALMASYPDPLFAISTEGVSMPVILKALAQFENTRSSYAFGEFAHASFIDKNVTVADISRYLDSQGISVSQINEIRPTIEDRFIQLATQKV